MSGDDALVVFPGLPAEFAVTPESRRWLSRGSVSQPAAPAEALNATLRLLGLEPLSAGLGALRLLGQTGLKPQTWVAAADPVHFEARLRDVRVRAMPDAAVSEAQLREIFATLEAEFGQDDGISFSCVERSGYIVSHVPISLPAVSAGVADGSVPDTFLSADKSDKRFHALIGEIQMLLHEHEVNLYRQQAGLPSINSLWMWGGGVLPAIAPAPLPRLFADDALFKAYWSLAGARSCSLDAWLHGQEQSGGVIVLPRGTTVSSRADQQGNELRDHHQRILRGKYRRLKLLFGDGTVVSLRKTDRFKFWRKGAGVFEVTANA